MPRSATEPSVVQEGTHVLLDPAVQPMSPPTVKKPASSAGTASFAVETESSATSRSVRRATFSRRPPVLRTPPTSSDKRLLSLDVLRGFAMFWITGGREFAMAAVACATSPSSKVFDVVETQLTHPRWSGFVVWDMVMPIFLFVVGATLPLSLAKHVGQDRPLRPVYWRIFRRVAVLWACGILVQQMRYWPPVPELYSNALQAIAVGYLATSILILHVSVAWQVATFFALLLGYWALLTFVPFGGHSAGTLERTANLARYVDEWVLNASRRDHSFTWIVTSLGFAATVLMGSFAGRILTARWRVADRLLGLSAIGIVCLAAGWAWSYQLPLNRHLWTSSMILWAGGWSFLLVALLHLVIDVAKVRAWAFPFAVIGGNALLAYVLDPLLDRTAYFGTSRLLGACSTFFASSAGAPFVDLLSASLEIGLLWLLLWRLYRKRALLRA